MEEDTTTTTTVDESTTTTTTEPETTTTTTETPEETTTTTTVEETTTTTTEAPEDEASTETDGDGGDEPEAPGTPQVAPEIDPANDPQLGDDTASDPVDARDEAIAGGRADAIANHDASVGTMSTNSVDETAQPSE